MHKEVKWKKFTDRTYGSYISQAHKYVAWAFVEDLVQDVYYILFNKYSDKPIEEMDWIGSRILYNLGMEMGGHVSDVRKRYKLQTNNISEEYLSKGSSTYQPPLHDLYVVLQATDTLPEDKKIILDARLDGTYFRDIQHELGLPLGTIRRKSTELNRQMQAIFPEYK